MNPIATTRPAIPTKLSITLDGKTWVATAADLYLSDAVRSLGYGSPGVNHPRLTLTLLKKGETNPEAYGARQFFAVEFQRDMVEERNSDRRSLGVLDTRREWAACYGGRVELGYATNKWSLRDSPFRLDYEDRLRIELGRRIARVIRAHDLDYLGDEALEVVEALRLLGVKTSCTYCYEQGGQAPLERVDGRGANQRALQLPEGEEPSVVLWTTAPEAYDGCGTTTIETHRALPGINDEPVGRLVRVLKTAERWQTCRYESGNHAAVHEAQFPPAVAIAA